MIRKAREFFRFDANTRAALNTMLHYIMGKGLSITPKSKDPMVWYIWREFWSAPRNKMALKQFEIVLRTLRDGELFIEHFDEDEEKKKTGKTTIRFIDPLMVRAKDTSSAPTSQTLNNGVLTDPEDVEKVTGYTVQSRVNENDFRTVPAEKCLHIKVGVDSDQKRGETTLLAIMNMIKHYEQWIENRIILNKMRTAIVMIKYVNGSPGEVANIAATIPQASTPSNQTTRQNIRGGTVVTANAGVKYEMLSANINASDVKEDGRNIKLNMAAGMNLPEYVFGDASNNNFASSLIAEAPFVKSIQFWQIFFEYWLSQLYRIVIENAVKGGLVEAPNDEEFINKLKKLRPIQEAAGASSSDDVPQSAGAETSPTAKIVKQPEVDPKEQKREDELSKLMPDGKMEMPSEIFFGCDMDWPEIIHRDIKEQVDALSIARQNGWLADSTATAALGYDYPEEVRKQKAIEEEAAKNGNPLLGQQDAGTMDSEMNDIMAQLTPEEKQTVLNSTDPKEVQAIMAKYAPKDEPAKPPVKESADEITNIHMNTPKILKEHVVLVRDENGKVIGSNKEISYSNGNGHK
jgi:hypothetical protein